MKRGYFHPNHCEDFLMTAKLSPEKTMAVVLDGCSMGVYSVFAAHLLGKVLRASAQSVYAQNFRNSSALTLGESLTEIMQITWSELIRIRQQLQLTRTELLTTMILAVVDEDEKQAEILIAGDGVVQVDQDFIEFDQGNKPDYLGYHLNKTFEDWRADHTQQLSVPEFRDLSISTDGILSFQNLEAKELHFPIEEAIHELLVDRSGSDSSQMLKHKAHQLERHKGLVCTDDLAIIRMIAQE
ncbi:protein phosphatase 2C domain-containing protein [Pontibacter sp. G13]|uniref:protein phosphatase 2C domain-containing protein n=1 Tax=Pontibacter sp. G13 TaxID=3074898 RepID=UPI00288ADE09|nr:protein phosphatase 2C domain-containing protein [Pontibacter sp. G13]WNJ17851.1 protein phosphatase 2C domain-containing protein [Pontibacter sp. G13]